MTYCVGITLETGLVLASDSRTNAGLDQIARFCKMSVYQRPGERVIVLLSAGNLATGQQVRGLLEQRSASLYGATSLGDVAALVGRTQLAVQQRDAQGPLCAGVDFGASFIVGGQIAGEPPRLFHIYPQGNFIEAGCETPYFQLGENKYGKPLLDALIGHDTSLPDAAKALLLAFDSTMRSNLCVGPPIDLAWIERDRLAVGLQRRIEHDDAYFGLIRRIWAEQLRRVFGDLPAPAW